jgi:hypothetical protein
VSSLQRVRDLLGDYADLPMDYADATLVVLAEEIGTDLVFTTDRRDFGVYPTHLISERHAFARKDSKRGPSPVLTWRQLRAISPRPALP